MLDSIVIQKNISISESRFFYTDQKESSKTLAKSNVVLTKEDSKRSLKPEIKEIDHNKSISDIECVEVSFEIEIADDKKQECVDAIFEDMLVEILGDDLWQGIFFSANNNPTEPDENIYGIRTNLNAVCEYCDLLIKYVEDNHFEKVLYRIQKLKHSTGNSSNSDQKTERVWESKTDPSNIMTLEMYSRLESQILENYKDLNIIDLLFEMQKIYHRCVFDAFNQIFSNLLAGKMDSYLSPDEFRMRRKNTLASGEVLFLMHKAKMILLDYTICMVGLIQNKEDSMMGKSLRNIDQDAVELIKEDKLVTMLWKDVREERLYPEIELNHEISILSQKVEDALLDDLINEFFKI